MNYPFKNKTQYRNNSEIAKIFAKQRMETKIAEMGANDLRTALCIVNESRYKNGDLFQYRKNDLRDILSKELKGRVKEFKDKFTGIEFDKKCEQMEKYRKTYYNSISKQLAIPTIPVILVDIQPEPSFLNNIRLEEPVDLAILDALIHSGVLLETFNNKYAAKKYNNEREQLLKYRDLITLAPDGITVANITYGRPREYGRVNPKGALGLHSIRREIRHTLARQFFVDIDISNAFPTIASQICKMLMISCKYLDKYINNRDDIMVQIIRVHGTTKDCAKRLILILMFGGKYDDWIVLCKPNNVTIRIRYILELQNELEKIMVKLGDHNPKLRDSVKQWKVIEAKKGRDNTLGSILSFYLQTIEHKILETIFLYCRENGIIKKRCVLSNDGIMIPRESYRPELNGIFSDLIRNKFLLNIQFVVKDMDQGYDIAALTPAIPPLPLRAITNKLGGDTLTDINTTKFLASFDLNGIPIETITQHHFTKRIVIFNIGMGGGKTSETINYLKQTSDNNFILITPRKALGNNIMGRFKENEVSATYYLNKRVAGNGYYKLAANENIVIQCESIAKIDLKTNKYHTVVIDEIESVLNCWVSEETHGVRLCANFTAFKQILMDARKIILLDAFVTTKTTHLLQALGLMKYTIYNSAKIPEERTIIANNIPYLDIVKKMINDLNNNKKIYVFHAHKSAQSGKNGHYSIDGLNATLHNYTTRKIKTQSYHGDTSDIIKNRLADVNTEWSELDAVLTTSTITVGVNYDRGDYDKVYLLVSGTINDARDVIQTSMRIRNPREKTIELFYFNRFNKTCIKKPDYYNECNDDIYKSLVDDIYVEKQSSFTRSLQYFCARANYKFVTYDKIPDNIASNINIDLDSIICKELIPYDEVYQILNDNEFRKYENNVYCNIATKEEKYAVRRYYFDIQFRHTTEDNRRFIWDSKYTKFFTGINNPLIHQLLAENKVNNIIELKPHKMLISDELYDNFKKQFKLNIKFKIQAVVKAINTILGIEAIISIKKGTHYKYIISDIAESLYKIFTEIDKKKRDEQISYEIIVD